MRVRELTAGRGVDLVVETISPDTIEQSLIAASLYGQIVLLITRGGKTSRIDIEGSAWWGSLASIRRIFVGSRADLEATNRAIASHKLRPVMIPRVSVRGCDRSVSVLHARRRVCEGGDCWRPRQVKGNQLCLSRALAGVGETTLVATLKSQLMEKGK